ncbi:hypothetical protein [Oceanidesulfovibrio marinus]|uniref:DUF2795 domain-containing protein n=1 Tax=Oceanidesulfovibrio marinus TaxID=370038 RepID=A0A6P1ZFT9_9BACT|nr:hypothetical protein [Oceanidesulfovibrio marinus]QJT09280.1 hypothetical protein E8L03_10155 [Oceanidesulfovibrio marinus]TVM32775.1 hypothetical protein DQK91_13770 [Oceanidesulfovibrio marinus]
MERRLTQKEIQSYLEGMNWPATRKQLKDQLFSQGIESSMLSVLTDTSRHDIQSEDEARRELEQLFHHS